MKKVKLSSLKDNARFCISNRNTAATYRLHKKKKGTAYFSSEESNRTFSKPAKTLVYV